ncbi:SusC/RagA family TonB-linked outer membrane protein [Flavobacterium polysaccharolyticum]|uniref:TonB-dependent receptor n=1 Tax=Flavobacterium polysaccharolyticum TaxID=3133148 RepID=A0ABU9NPI1_9FLAO
MRSKFKWIFSFLLMLSIQFIFAQTKTVSGTVSDETGALPGVNIVVVGSKTSTQTGFDGTYFIKAKEGDVLLFSFLGMDNTKVTVNASSVFDVKMKGTVKLEEVVVVAYGKAKKSSYTGSAVAIKAEVLENRAVTNVLSAIEGATSGVQIQSASGQPGTAPAVRIRGFSSVNGSNTPLYVVDGVPFAGDISNINSNDIESLTILKDASSTSLYGSKAANGVIIITTKSGKSSKDKFSVNISQGLSSRMIKEYERVNAYDYYPLIWESIRNSRAMGTTAQIDAANLYASNRVAQELVVNPFNVPNTQIVGLDGKLNPNASLLYPEDLDWSKHLERAGVRQNADFSYQGKSEKSNYFASIGYLNEEGYIQKSDYERVSARLNLNTSFNDWFKTGINLSGTTTDSNLAVDGVANSTSINNPFRTIRYMGPIYPVFDHAADGSYIYDSAGNKVYSTVRGSGASNGRNIVYETLNNKDNQKGLALSARTFAEFKFLSNFKFTVNASLDKSYFNRTFAYNKEIGDGAPNGLLSKENRIITGLTYNQLLNYDKKIGNHTFSALLGHESFDYRFDWFNATKTTETTLDNTEFINYVTPTALSSYQRGYATESYFTRVGYDFMDKYIVSASLRRDGSSKFAKNNRWGNFWSFGGAWVISKENFLTDSSWLNELKLRSSIGEVGNDSHTSNDGLSFYASQPTFGLGFDNGNEGGLLTNDQGAPNLKWEKNTQKDVAVEFGLFNNRLNGSVEYYNRSTDGLIFAVPNPLSSGLDNRIENIGSMFNSGFEVTLEGKVIKTKDFTWGLNLSASTIKNEITSLPQKEIINGTKKFTVGSSIYDYWLRDWYGVDPADGYALYVSDPALIVAGDTTQRVVNGVNVTTDQNKALYSYNGSSIPDLFGSFGTNLEYKGLKLNVLFSYQLGGLTYDSNYAALMHTGITYGSALSVDALDRWQKAGDITNVPRMDINRNTQSTAQSDRWLISSDFLSLRQVNLSYNLPSQLTTRLGIDNSTLYVNGENLLLFTKRQGLDPSQTFNGTSQNRFTPSRVITLGMNLNF